MPEVDVGLDRKRSLRPENLLKLQEQLEIAGYPQPTSQDLDFPLNDSSAKAGEKSTLEFADWSYFDERVIGHHLHSQAHSLVWNKKFVERVSKQATYFDDFKHAESAKPPRDTKANRLKTQRAKQMAGRFKIATKRMNEARARGESISYRGYDELGMSSTARSDVSTKAMSGNAAKIRPVPIPEDPRKTEKKGKGRRRK